ncbi:MAG: thermonuclease family protein [Halioglobus sp.]
MKKQLSPCYSFFLLFLMVLANGIQAASEISDYEGWVITVLSGDTVRVLDGSNRMTTVRLQSIDAPQRGQPYGEEARKYLASLLSGKEVKVKPIGIDDFGNTIGTIWVEPPKCRTCKKTLDVNYALLEVGMAWWYQHFAKKQSSENRERYEAAQSKAKSSKLGLWADPEPEAPWDWRARNDDHRY